MNKKVFITAISALGASTLIVLTVAAVNLKVNVPIIQAATSGVSDVSSYVSDTSSLVSSEVSSIPSAPPAASSAVSSTVIPIVSSTPYVSPPPPASTPVYVPPTMPPVVFDPPKLTVATDNNIALKQAAMQAENDRHATALNALNALYDPQIATSNALIQGYKDSGAKDTSADIATMEQQVINSQIYLNNGPPATRALSPLEIEIGQRHLDEIVVGLQTAILVKADYDKMTDEQTKLATLQSKKVTAITSENNYFLARQDQISVMFN